MTPAIEPYCPRCLPSSPAVLFSGFAGDLALCLFCGEVFISCAGISRLLSKQDVAQMRKKARKPVVSELRTVGRRKASR